MAAPFQPIQFGRYLLTDRLAVGGMAEIFSGKLFGAMGFEKKMVIKRILPQFAIDEEFLRMFVTEAKLVCHLEHPNIVQVHELGETAGQYYIAMEYVNGIDARQMWRTLAKRRQRLPGVLALFVVAEFLKGLDYAHRAVGPDNQLLGVVHRDVSPSNIFISYRGDVKIGDFGVALVQQETKTQAGVLKGKYGYMSPEQVAGLAVDHRSDLFAAGVVLTELLLGRRLFLGRSDFETLDKVMNVRLDVLDQHQQALPEEVARIARRALQRERTDRYQSAREFCDDINEFLYERRERVTTEMLAAFINQHVTPYLPRSSDSTEVRAVGAHDGPPSASSPMLPDGLVPDRLAGPAASSAPDEFGPLPGSAAHTGRDPSAVQRSSPAAAAPGTDAPEPQAPMPLWDTIIDEEQFGAIPESEGDSAPSAAAKLGPLARATPAGSAEPGPGGSGSGLDWRGQPDGAGGGAVDGDFTPPPGSLISELLDTAAAVGDRDKPDFAGQLGNRTVAKVLFRFAVVAEDGLITLTGPDSEGDQDEIVAWLNELRRLAPKSRQQAERTCEIHLEHGQPHLVSADRSEEALIAHLLGEEALERQGVEKAVRAQSQRGLVSALLHAGLLTPLQVSRHVTAFVIQNVIDCFSWSEGSFAFYRDRECSAEAFPTGLDALELVLQGVAALPETALIEYFGGLGNPRLVANPAAPKRIEDFPEHLTLAALYARLAAAATVNETLASCTDLAGALDLQRALYLLIECEMLELS